MGTGTLSYEAIEKIAGELRDTVALDDEGRTDVVGLVESLGGHVEVTFEEHDRPESLQVRGPGDFTVIVPWNTSNVRDRFTIAHELGHLYLHYDASTGPRSFFRYGQDRHESEANVFAAALLMPRDAFKTAHANLDGDLTAIATRFGVSRSSAGVRASVLGLI